MSLYDKASDNYAVAESAFREKRYDVAASRVYYAVYQACVKRHMESGRTAGDFLFANERAFREKSLKSNTDAPKWPHDILVRRDSLVALGLNAAQRQMVLQAKKMRVVGDYGDMNTVEPDDLEPVLQQAGNLLRQFRVDVQRR